MTADEWTHPKEALHAPVKSVAPYTLLADDVFPRKKKGDFFKITLASGRAFIACVQPMRWSDIILCPVKEDTQTPFSRLTITHSSGFGGPGCHIRTEPKDPADKDDCTGLFTPRQEPRSPRTPFLYYYAYAPLIDKAWEIQGKLAKAKMAGIEMQKAQEELEALFASGPTCVTHQHKPNNLTLTQQHERN